MLPATEKLRSITHPLVASMHMKKDFGAHVRPRDVLVIETAFSNSNDEPDLYASHLMDLLLDLEDLKQQAETHVGKFDRVDIRTH